MDTRDKPALKEKGKRKKNIIHITTHFRLHYLAFKKKTNLQFLSLHSNAVNMYDRNTCVAHVGLPTQAIK